VDVPDRATTVAAPACADCRVQARVAPGAAREAGVFLRGSAATSDRYDAVVLDDGRLQLRRLDAGRPTVLAEAPSGIADRTALTLLTLDASGAGPVTLTASVAGGATVTATDASASAKAAPGQAGLWTYTAGVRFDDFQLLAR
jgi:hypothetical protein